MRKEHRWGIQRVGTIFINFHSDASSQNEGFIALLCGPASRALDRVFDQGKTHTLARFWMQGNVHRNEDPKLRKNFCKGISCYRRDQL